MSFLLDTVVISQLTKPKVPEAVRRFLQNNTKTAYLSIFTLYELRYGALKAPSARKREWLLKFVASIEASYQHSILPFDLKCSEIAAELQIDLEKKGRPLTGADLYIGATAKAHGLTIVTRNVKHFDPMGIKLLNPWDEDA